MNLSSHRNRIEVRYFFFLAGAFFAGAAFLAGAFFFAAIFLAGAFLTGIYIPPFNPQVAEDVKNVISIDLRFPLESMQNSVNFFSSPRAYFCAARAACGAALG